MLDAGAFVVGVVTALLVGVGGIAILSVLIVNGRVGEEQAAWYVGGWLFLSMFAGCLLCNLKHSAGYSYVPIAVSAAGALVLVICGLLFFEGPMDKPLPMISAAIAGGIAACLVQRKSRSGNKKRKYRYR